MTVYVLQDSKTGRYFFNELGEGEESEFMSFEEVIAMVNLYRLKSDQYKVYALIETTI